MQQTYSNVIRSTNSKKKKNAAFYVRNFSRIFMGLLFIFSAYVKMVDPFGFGLKLEEYFVSFGMDFMSSVALPFAILAIGSEFIIGWALLLNIQMRFTSWALLAFMTFFLCLTFWLAFAQDIVALINRLFGTSHEIFVVTDCGCFGDFLIMTNPQTFYKNVIFMIFTLIIFLQRKSFPQNKWYYITQWCPILLVTGLALFIQIHCLFHEPWHDFRPWKVGNYIAAETYSQAPEIDYMFVYQNNTDGINKEISMEELSAISQDSLATLDLESNYTYVNRVEKIIKAGINPRLADFTISDINTRQDIKNEIIMSNDYTFIVMLRDLNGIDKENLTNVSLLLTDLENKAIKYVILTNSLPTDIEAFKKIHNWEDRNFYFCDATSLKTAIRNTPGVIMVKEGYVMDKWAYRDVPLVQEILEKMPKYERKLKTYKQRNPPTF